MWAWLIARPIRLDLIILLILALLALLPRLFRLNSAPAGLGGDEFFNAIDALRLGPGNWQIYFASNNGREAFFNYLMALPLRLFGQQVWAVRLPAVLLGVGSVLLAYGIGRNEFNRRVGFIAGAIMSVSLWPIMHSRWGLRAVSLTFLTALSIYLYGLAFQGKGRSWLLWLASGLALGLTMYTYIPSRIFPVVVLGWMIWISLTQRDLIRQKWRSITISLLTALVVFAPYGLFIFQNPATVNQRLQAFSSVVDKLQKGEITALWIPVKATIEMIFISGDEDFRYYMVGRPVFDPLSAIFFVTGLISVIWRAFARPRGEDKRATYGMLLLWTGIMLIPGAIVGLDNFTLRASGTIVPIYLILALGLDAVYSWLKRLWPKHQSLLQAIFASLLVLGLTMMLLGTWRAYFDQWTNATEVRNIYHNVLAEVGRYLDENPPPEGTDVFFAYDYVNDTTPQSFVYYSDTMPTWFDHGHSFSWRPTQDELWYIETVNKPMDSQVMDRLKPVSESEIFYFENGDEAFSLYKIEPSAIQWSPQHRADQQFVDGPKLIGFDIPEATFRGDSVPVTLHWQVPADLPQLPNRLTFAKVLLLDESGNAWGQVEKLMGYPEAGWQSGDRFTTFLDVQIPEGMPPGPFYLQIGLRDWSGPEYKLVSGTPQALGPMIARSRPLEDITVSDETPVFGSTLALQSHSLSTILEPGIPIDLALDWLALEPPEDDYRVKLTLTQLGEKEPFLEQVFEMWPGVYSPSQWQKGEQVTTFHRLHIPLDIPSSDNAELGIQLLHSDSDEPLSLDQGSQVLTELSLVTREHIFLTPAIDQPLEAQFGPDIRLLGYELDSTAVSPGDQVSLTLYWLAIDTPEESYTVFNHIISPDGQMQGQLDSPPVGEGWLTTTWLPGEIITDRRLIPIRPDAATGKNELIVGLYTAGDVKRLPVILNNEAQPGDQLKLTTITIEPG